MSGTIVALGGLSPDRDDNALHRFIVDAANRRKPRICYVPVASGDFERYVELFYQAYPTSICQPRHLELLRSVTDDPAGTLAAQDVVYLGGGSTPVLVAALRVLGLDEVLRGVWERGGVLCGDSAGAHAWFEGCITDSLGPGIRVFGDGLGLVAGACAAHFDQERSALLGQSLIAGELPGPAWGIEDGTALVLSDGGAEAVSPRDRGGAHRLVRRGDAVEIESLDARRI